MGGGWRFLDVHIYVFCVCVRYKASVCVWWGFHWGWIGLFPLRLLHDRWAAASGLFGSAGIR